VMCQPSCSKKPRLSQPVLNSYSPGMYAIRYQGTRSKNSAGTPTQRSVNIPLSLSQAPIRMAGEIEFISPEGIHHQTLSEPGDYLVAHVRHGDAVLAVSKYSPKPLVDMIDVQWRIESLQQPLKRHAAQILPKAAPPPSAATSIPLTLTGHIERRGDVTVNSGEWLGDPQGSARLEGFLIESSAFPEEVELLSACRAGEQTLQAKQNGYLGTKRQATAITQLALCLGGEKASGYELEAEAAFSDGSRQPLGRKEAVMAANGKGHLVAVRLRLHKGDGAAPSRQVTATQSSWLDPKATYVAKA